MIEAGSFRTDGSACRLDIPPIPGDLVPPAVVTIEDDGTGIWYVIATRRRGNPADLEWTADAKVKYFPPARRRTKSDPGSHEAPGTYAAFVQACGEGAVWLTKGERENAPKTVTTQVPLWFDLGLFQVNGGRGPLAHDARTIGAFPVAAVPIGVKADAGVTLGEVVFLPADETTAWIRTNPGEPCSLVVDGINRATYRQDANGALLPQNGAIHYGGLPLLGIRGQSTRLFVLAGVTGGAPATKPVKVTVTYRENHRDIGPFLGGAPEPQQP